jgi:hypothetical protein
VALHPVRIPGDVYRVRAGGCRRSNRFMEVAMSNYEKLTRKADALEAAAKVCKTGEGREVLSRFSGTIRAVRDSMTVEEAEA